jgi:hypothetical protein
MKQESTRNEVESGADPQPKVLPKKELKRLPKMAGKSNVILVPPSQNPSAPGKAMPGGRS